MARMGKEEENYYEEEKGETYSTNAMDPVLSTPSDTLLNMTQQDFEFIMATNPFILKHLCVAASLEMSEEDDLLN
tara:strand:- start:1171 stop:1395 length:225 start_codon:yes stop_codon:yes gene_type:complete